MGKIIGENLKRERIARGYTLKDLADMLAEYDLIVSESMISQWESGKKRMYADQLMTICNALKVSPYRLLGDIEVHGNESILHDVVRCLPDDEKDIFEYIYCSWDGNPRALVKFLGLYISLPKELRQDISGMGLTMFNIGVKRGMIDTNAPIVDLDYIDKEWGKLLK